MSGRGLKWFVQQTLLSEARHRHGFSGEQRQSEEGKDGMQECLGAVTALDDRIEQPSGGCPFVTLNNSLDKIEEAASQSLDSNIGRRPKMEQVEETIGTKE